LIGHFDESKRSHVEFFGAFVVGIIPTHRLPSRTGVDVSHGVSPNL
jgi:hypothetical protein